MPCGSDLTYVPIIRDHDNVCVRYDTQSAAIHAQYSEPKNPAVVRRVNVAGRYATVLTSGGRIEGELNTDAIFLQHFSFGWQPLEVLNFRCSLEAHELKLAVERRLLSGMPEPKDDRPCRSEPRDYGRRADVEAVRRIMRGPFVPYVVVSGDWALGEWYGAGGGEALYRKRDATWRLVEGGGGAMGVHEMRKNGVPQSAWCVFGILGAKC